MTYIDMQKLAQVKRTPPKEFIQRFKAPLTCQVTVDVINDVPLPVDKDFSWEKISHREVRVTLIDMKTK